MKITERRLRSIIRSVIKESMNDQHHVGHRGPDPDQALGRPTPESFKMKIHSALQDGNIVGDQGVDELRKIAELQGYTNFEEDLSSIKVELDRGGYYY